MSTNLTTTETLTEKVARMNRTADTLATTRTFAQLCAEKDTLVAKRLACINEEVKVTPAQYSALNERISILVSAIAKQISRTQR